MAKQGLRIVCFAFVFACSMPGRAATVTGDLTKWHRVTVDFVGPFHHEMDSNPNPFLDYRLQVRFTSPGGDRLYDVPGFFDGDGSGGASGSVWRARFAPDEAGTWTFVASFRSGAGVAVDLSPTAGAPAWFDGESGSFVVAERDASAPGVLRYGRLESVGRHHFKFRDGGYWAKVGTNNPENLLGYRGFDNTPYAWHSFANHVADWNPGDPDWDSPDTTSTTDGRGIIGALNYLAAQGLNSIYFMPMNIGADGKDTWPYASASINRDGSAGNDNRHFDLSKLAQWEIVFTHAQRKSLLLHWVLSDKTVANKNELDNATLGIERKLFYREMAARFAHHNAMQWNLCEEYNLDLPLSPATIDAWGDYLLAVDPYDHPITVHSHGNTYETALAPFLDEDWFKVMSVQTWQLPEDIGSAIEYFREETTRVGNPIPVNLDECIGMNQISAAEYRKRTVWDALLSGGGFEMFKSYGDSDLDDFRVYETYFRYGRYAREFVASNLPFETMGPADSLVTGEDPLYGGAEVFAREGEVYAVYLPKASPEPSLSLADPFGSYEQTWYNPRTGAFEGPPRELTGGGTVGLGAPPSDPNEDWVVLVRRNDLPPVRSDGSPTGVLPPGTSTTTLSLTTDVEAHCRHAPVPGIAYGDMPADFEGTGGTAHSTPSGPLEDGKAYVHYVRCSNAAGLANLDDYPIRFSVGSESGGPIGDRAVWYLDEGTGTITSDSSGQGNTGTLAGGAEWVAAYAGTGLRFDGVAAHVTIPDSPSLDFSAWPGATVALWTRPERLDHPNDQTLYAHWASDTSARTFQILVTPDNRLRCRTDHDDGVATAPSPVVPGSWVHVTCVWSPEGLRLFLDGRAVAEDLSVSTPLPPNEGLHTLGVREKTGEWSQHFAGVLDEVHVFGRDLSAEEVRLLFESIGCPDADRDGVRRCDGDCNDANPDCSTDCTDVDTDGICAPRDCDDATPSAGSTAFGQPVTAADRDTFRWTSPADVRWRKGDIADFPAYGTLAAGSLLQATSLDVSADAPGPGQGVYYLVRELGCGSWQSQIGSTPGRDRDLPLP